MKIFYSIFILTILTKTFLYSQVTEPIVDSTKQWNILWYYSFSGFGTESYTLKNDTVLNNNTYFKLYLKNNPTYNFGYTGKVLREDSMGRVYIADYTNQVLQDEYLLYDFNLQVGESFDVRNECYTAYQYGAQLRVLSIDTVFIAGKNRKRIELEHSQFIHPDNGNEYWYEGMGSSLGLIYPGAQVFDMYFSLLCFTGDSIETIVNTNYNDCWITLNTEMINNDLSVEIYPNPVKDRFNIVCQVEATLEIINLQGQTIETKYLTEKSNDLDLSNLTNGVYSLRITTDSGIVIRKLVKQ